MEDKNKTFDFATAVKHLQDGKKVRCVSWNLHIYCWLTSSGLRRYSFRTGYHKPSELRLFASDFASEWELYNV